MARKTEVITVTTATDDVTGFIYGNEMAAMVKRYKVTIIEVDENDLPVSADKGITFLTDMHNDTYHALTQFLNGHLMEMLRTVLSVLFGITKAGAIYDHAAGNNDDEFMVTVFGGNTKKSAGNKSTSGNPYTAYVRAYAISKGWTGANGNKIADKGKMSQDVVIKFVTETGITVERFNAGDRIPE